MTTPGVRLINSPVSVIGMVLTTISAVLFLIVFLADLFGLHSNPYIGLVFFVLLPGVFVLGLGGGVRHHRRRTAGVLSGRVFGARHVTCAGYRRSPRRDRADLSGKRVPRMRVGFGTYPNSIDHIDSPGCFRCHDDSHETKVGRTIGQDCDSCHKDRIAAR